MVGSINKIRFATLLPLILFFTEKIFAVEFFIKPEIGNYRASDDNLYGFYSDSNFEIDNPYLLGSRFGINFSKNILIFNKISIYSGFYQTSREYSDSDRFGDSINKKMELMFFDLGLKNSFRITDKPINWSLGGGILFGNYIFDYNDLLYDEYDYSSEGNGIGSVFDWGFYFSIMDSFDIYTGIRYTLFKPEVKKINYPQVRPEQYGIGIDNHPITLDMSGMSYNISLVFTFGKVGNKEWLSLCNVRNLVIWYDD